MFLAQFDQNMKEGIRMRIITSMIANINEQKKSENEQLEQFRSYIGYKYPILSPKRSGAERANAGYTDHTDTPSRI